MAGKIAAGGGGRKGQMAPNSDPNVIPFIDIMLVLLIIFMVTAPIPTVDVRVDLPPPNAIPTRVEGLNPTMVKLVEQPGGYVLFVDDQPTTLEGLTDKVLERAIINNPSLNPVDVYAEARVFLRADQTTAYRNVINVMSILQEGGFAKVGIFAEQAQL
ncbi:MAG: ExbD/TolR family protein [Hyphomonadaceae bacterium]